MQRRVAFELQHAGSMVSTKVTIRLILSEIYLDKAVVSDVLENFN